MTSRTLFGCAVLTVLLATPSHADASTLLDWARDAYRSDTFLWDGADCIYNETGVLGAPVALLRRRMLRNARPSALNLSGSSAGPPDGQK